MNLRASRILSCLVVFTLTLGSVRGGEVIANFENLTLAPDSAFQGPTPGATIIDGPYGPVAEGSFTTGGVSLINQYDLTYGSWSGFAYSNQVDTTAAGWLNQSSAYPGAAHSGDNFGVAFGYHNLAGANPFDPLNISHLEGLPYLTLPEDAAIQGMYVANTTYTALSLLLGDSFSGRPMGGVNGDIPDWYKLTAYGTDAAGDVLTDASGSALFVDLFLGDNRQGQMFIADQWMYMDLSGLVGAERLYFNVSGSLTGPYGLNTPSYFAVDDVTYTVNAAAVPEPGSLAMAASAVLIVGLVARRRTRA